MRRGLARLTAGLLAAVLLCMSAGCEQEVPDASSTPAETLVPTTAQTQTKFTLPCYPEAGFHPITGANRTNLTLSGLMYEGLFELDQTFTPQPLLCSGYAVSGDGLTWTFFPRGDVTFSDGSPLTAAEVVSSLNSARSSTLYAARLAGIQGIRAAEEAVVLTLGMPNGGLPALLDIPIVKETGGNPLGTGPYMLDDSGQKLALTARAGWWRGHALPKESILLRTIRAAGDLIHAFDTRDITLVATDLTGTNALGFSGAYETTDYPTGVMLYVGFNCTSGPCRERAVRQALQRSMDRATISTALLSRHARPAALPTAPESALYDNVLADTLASSPRAAEELLESVGWSKMDGVYTRDYQIMRLTLAAPSDNVAKLAVAEYLAESLTDAGFSVTLEALSWEDYLTALETGNFDLYLGEVRMTADFDPTVFVAPTGALNYSGYADSETSALLSTFRSAAGDARPAAAQALYSRLAEQAPFAVLCFKNWSVLTQRNQISGLTPTQQNVFYGFADWNIR